MDENQAVAEFLNKTGGFTKSQLWLFFVTSIVTFISGQTAVQIIFLAKDLPHRCVVPGCDTENSSFIEEFLNFTTPFDDASMTWDSCHTFSFTGNDKCEILNFDASEISECSEWIYDTSVFRSTSVSEFNLVCEEEWKQPLPNSFLMIGMTIGAILIGGIADIIGRRNALVLSLFIAGIGQSITAIVFDFYSLLASRLLVGIGTTALFEVSFLLLIEQSSISYRNFYGLMIQVPFAIGEASVALLAYYVRFWRPLQGIMAIFTLLMASIYYWFLPESIRWLLSKKQIIETRDAAGKQVKLNQQGMKHYEKFISSLNDLVGEKKQTVDDIKEQEIGFLQIFKYSNTRNRFFKFCFCWFAINMSYYGLSANSVNLGGDVFINFAAVMLIEVPALFFGNLIINRCGKKGSMMFVLLLGGVSCISSGLLPAELTWLISALSMIGKFGTAAGFAIVYLYSAELFPTATRAICIGACSTCGRTGAIIAPYISFLATIYRPLPLLVFGALGLMASVVIIFLPETVGAELPQTIEESEAFGTDQSVWYFSCYCKRPNKKTLETQPSVNSAEIS